MKQMLLTNSITSSYAANCVAFHNSSIESVFEIRWSKGKFRVPDVYDDLAKAEGEDIPDIFSDEADEFGVTKENIL